MKSFKYPLSLLITGLIIVSMFVLNSAPALAVDASIASSKSQYTLGDKITFNSSFTVAASEQLNVTSVLLDISGVQPIRDLSVPTTVGTHTLNGGLITAVVAYTGVTASSNLSSYTHWGGGSGGTVDYTITWQLLTGSAPTGRYIATLKVLHAGGTTVSSPTIFDINPIATPAPVVVVPEPTPEPPKTGDWAPSMSAVFGVMGLGIVSVLGAGFYLARLNRRSEV